MKASEETIRAIFEASPDTIMLLDEHGFLDCNPATLKMFGCSSVDEFLGRHPSEYSPPTQADGRSSLEAANEKISTAYKTGSNLFEWTHQRVNGEIFPAEVQLTLLKLKEGDVLLATVRNITERRLAEAALAISEERYSLAMKGANDGLWDWNLLTNKVLYSKRWKSMLGYSEDELDDNLETWKMLLHPDDVKRAEKCVDDYLSGRKPEYEIEIRMQHKKGHWVNVLARGFAIRDESSKEYVRFVGTHVDVSRHKQVEAELLLKDMVFERSITANSIADSAGIITHANNTFISLWGYESKDRVIGKPISAFLSFDDEAEKIIHALNKTGKWEGEYTALKQDGTTFSAYGLATTIQNNSGEIIGYYSAVLDYSEHKQNEKERERLLHDAGERVKELRCLYGIAESIQVQSDIEDVFRDTLSLIPPGWQYPEITASVIRYHDKEFQSDNFKETPWSQAAEIIVDGELSGMVEIFYLEERPDEQDGPFLKEEFDLINGIGKALGGAIEHQQATMALIDEEEHVRGVIENALDAFVSMDDRGFIVDWNPEAEHMFGVSREEAVGAKLSDTIIPKEFREMHEAGLRQYLATGKSKVLNNPIEIKAIHKNGDMFPVELSIVPLVDNYKKVTFNAFIRNLSERKKAQEVILKSEASLKRSLIGTIGAVCKAVEARDPYTAGHQQRVSRLARTIAQEMGLDRDQIEGVRMGATIHDIGKIQVPSEILSKPSRLNDLEFMLMKSHTNTGYEILKDVEFPWPIADIAHQHHERMDGSGYPQGLKGDEICLEARIVAVADVVEAIASHRPYRAALGMEAAMNEITANRGSFYDPDVVDACLKIFEEKKFDFNEVRLKGM